MPKIPDGLSHQHPITGQQVDFNRHQVQKAKDKSSPETVKWANTNVLTADRRFAGHWKVAGFHVMNFFGGIMGQIGKTCAKSSYMLPQKEEMEGKRINIWKSMVRDIGQTYMNATGQDGSGSSALNKMAQGWTNTLGTLTSGVVALPIRYALNDRRMARVRDQFAQEVSKNLGAPVNYNQVKNADIENPALKQHRVKTRLENINAELYLEHTTKHGDAKAATMTGSQGLRAEFLDFCIKSFTVENLHFYTWASPLREKLDPKSDNFDADHRVTKKELLNAATDFVDSNGKYCVNLSFAAHGNLISQLGNTLGDYGRRLQIAEDTVKSLTKRVENAKPEEVAELKSQLEAAKLNLESIESEDIRAGDHPALCSSLIAASDEIGGLLSNEVTRFKTHIENEVKALGGTVAPKSKHIAPNLAMDDKKNFYRQFYAERKKKFEAVDQMNQTMLNNLAELGAYRPPAQQSPEPINVQNVRKDSEDNLDQFDISPPSEPGDVQNVDDIQIVSNVEEEEIQVSPELAALSGQLDKILKGQSVSGDNFVQLDDTERQKLNELKQALDKAASGQNPDQAAAALTAIAKIAFPGDPAELALAQKLGAVQGDLMQAHMTLLDIVGDEDADSPEPPNAPNKDNVSNQSQNSGNDAASVQSASAPVDPMASQRKAKLVKDIQQIQRRFYQLAKEHSKGSVNPKGGQSPLPKLLGQAAIKAETSIAKANREAQQADPDVLALSGHLLKCASTLNDALTAQVFADANAASNADIVGDNEFTEEFGALVRQLMMISHEVETKGL